MVKISRNDLGMSSCATGGHATGGSATTTEGQEESARPEELYGKKLWHRCATTTSGCTTSAATSPKEFSATRMPGCGTGVEVASRGTSGLSRASVGSVGLLPPEAAVVAP
jgi:hypothetical protein